MDDTDAINAALSKGRNMSKMATTQPAIVYLPPGAYLVSKTLQMAFYTFIHGYEHPADPAHSGPRL